MNRDYFIELYDYTDWANRKVWDCVLQLSEDDFRKPLDYSVGSIFEQCVHTMAVESWWLHFLYTGELHFISNLDDYPDRSSIRTKWDEVSATNRAYLLTLTDEELQRHVKPEFWDENEVAITVAQALCQVANHSTDHRAQILAMLHKLHAPTVGQDFLDYLHRNA